MDERTIGEMEEELGWDIEQVIRELEERITCSIDRDRKIYFLESEQILEPDLRIRAANVLFKLWSELEGPPLWAAVRRYASLIPEVEIETLLPLLKSPVVTTRQVGLQALSAIIGVSGQAPEAIRDAVFNTEIGAHRRSHSDESEDGALLMNIWIALTLAKDERADEIAERMPSSLRGLASRIIRYYRPAGP